MTADLKTNRRSLMLAGAALAVQSTLPGAARAQSGFPSKPVRMIVPFPAGGAADIGARHLSQNLATELGQSVIVDNRPGADGMIAAQEAFRADPDGHTIYLATATSLSFVPVTRKNPGYDPIRDFAALTHFISFTFFLVVHESVPGKDLKGVLDYVRANPGKVTYGSGNSTGIIGMAQLMKDSGTEMVHVPYKGEAQAAIDLATGRIQMMLVTPAVIPQIVKDGKARAVCVFLPQRSPTMPEVPTIEEAGLPLMRIALWGGFVAPAKTPPEIVARLSTTLRTAMAKPELKERLDKVGLVIRGDTPEEFGVFLREQLVAWREAVELARIPIET